MVREGLTTKRLIAIYDKDYFGTPINSIEILTYGVEQPLLVLGAGSELMIEKLQNGELMQVSER